jgi:hypothetical protein
MVPFDVEASTGLIGGTDGIKVTWNVLLVIQVICVWVLFPMFIVYYESYENDGLVSAFSNDTYVSIEEEAQAVHASGSAHVPGPSADHRAYLLLTQPGKSLRRPHAA